MFDTIRPLPEALREGEWVVEEADIDSPPATFLSSSGPHRMRAPFSTGEPCEKCSINHDVISRRHELLHARYSPPNDKLHQAKYAKLYGQYLSGDLLQVCEEQRLNILNSLLFGEIPPVTGICLEEVCEHFQRTFPDINKDLRSSPPNTTINNLARTKLTEIFHRLIPLIWFANNNSLLLDKAVKLAIDNYSLLLIDNPPKDGQPLSTELFKTVSAPRTPLTTNKSLTHIFEIFFYLMFLLYDTLFSTNLIKLHTTKAETAKLIARAHKLSEKETEEFCNKILQTILEEDLSQLFSKLQDEVHNTLWAYFYTFQQNDAALQTRYSRPFLLITPNGEYRQDRNRLYKINKSDPYPNWRYTKALAYTTTNLLNQLLQRSTIFAAHFKATVEAHTTIKPTKGLGKKRTSPKKPEGSFLSNSEVRTLIPDPYYKEVKWLALKIFEPEETIPSIRNPYKKASSYATDEGDRIHNIGRFCTDGKVFRKKIRHDSATILLDVSGSMAPQYEDIEKIAQLSPAVLVAAYNHEFYEHTGKGEPFGRLYILAKEGKVIKNLPKTIGQENDCDIPALMWLKQQPGPHIWVSDGGSIPEIGPNHLGYRSTERFVQENNIIQIGSIKALLDLLENPAKFREAIKKRSRSQKKEKQNTEIHNALSRLQTIYRKK